MIQVADLKPLQRQALLAAKTSPTQTLVRTRGGFRPHGGTALPPPVFTLRVVRMMHRAYLLTLDDEAFPQSAMLTGQGAALADQLQATTARKAQAGAA